MNIRRPIRSMRLLLAKSLDFIDIHFIKHRYMWLCEFIAWKLWPQDEWCELCEIWCEDKQRHESEAHEKE